MTTRVHSTSHTTIYHLPPHSPQTTSFSSSSTSTSSPSFNAFDVDYNLCMLKLNLLTKFPSSPRSSRSSRSSSLPHLPRPARKSQKAAPATTLPSDEDEDSHRNDRAHDTPFTTRAFHHSVTSITCAPLIPPPPPPPSTSTSSCSSPSPSSSSSSSSSSMPRFYYEAHLQSLLDAFDHLPTKAPQHKREPLRRESLPASTTSLLREHSLPVRPVADISISPVDLVRRVEEGRGRGEKEWGRRKEEEGEEEDEERETDSGGSNGERERMSFSRVMEARRKRLLMMAQMTLQRSSSSPCIFCSEGKK